MSLTPRLVTLFGGSGFIGRYIAQTLLAEGARVRFAERDPRRAWFLKPQGGLGQTQFLSADIAHPKSVTRAVEGADAVINLVGVLKGDFQKYHVEGAGNIARAASAAGATALVHVSAIGADPGSPSAYGRSKGEGEAAVRDAFTGATIVRPSIVFGREDQFTNRFAAMIRTFSAVLPVVRGEARFQPVYVGDVARAVASAAYDPARFGGHTYELGGPQVMSMAEIQRYLARETGRAPRMVALPDAAAATMARLTGWVPGAPITWDQWLMLQRDTVVAEGAKGLEAFGIEPTPLAAVAPSWLVQYRRQGRFAGLREGA